MLRCQAADGPSARRDRSPRRNRCPLACACSRPRSEEKRRNQRTPRSMRSTRATLRTLNTFEIPFPARVPGFLHVLPPPGRPPLAPPLPRCPERLGHPPLGAGGQHLDGVLVRPRHPPPPVLGQGLPRRPGDRLLAPRPAGERHLGLLLGPAELGKHLFQPRQPAGEPAQRLVNPLPGSPQQRYHVGSGRGYGRRPAPGARPGRCRPATAAGRRTNCTGAASTTASWTSR
jgi:hypothetical protein